MNARVAFSRRGWLVGAAVGLATLGSVVLTTYGQPGSARPATAQQSGAPRSAVQRELEELYGRESGVRHADAELSWADEPGSIRQTAGGQPAPSSAVLNELEKLYARDGREMPEMELPAQSVEGGMQQQMQQQAMPHPAMPSPGAAGPPVTTNRRLQPQQKEKRGFLSRLFGGFRSRKQPQQHAQPAPTAPSQQPHRAAEQAHSPGLLPGFLRRLNDDPEARPIETPRVAAQPQLPAAQSPQHRPMPELPELPDVPVIQERSAPVRTNVAAQGLANPFPEGPESELNEKPGPFTGLTLDENEDEDFQKPVIRPLPLDAAPQQRETRTAQEFPEPGPSTTAGLDNPFEEFEQPAETAPPADADTQMKLQKIAQRPNLSGLKGFCPVTLRDRRDLVDGSPQFSSVYNDQTYFFATAEAKARFDANPAKYSPVKGGRDVISLAVHEEQAESGSLDHAVWYQDRLYLFNSAKSLEAFVLDPAHYAVQEIESGPRLAQ